jgi:8-oxo-dGTP diphosphatase
MLRLRVAAGILRDSSGRVLIAERVGGGAFQGMWEFPGGKIGDGESPEQALERELAEELGIELGAAERFMHLEHDYADRSVSIDFFLVSSWINEPRGIEGQQLRWVETRLLAEHDLLPADVPVIEALQQMAS